MNYTNCEFMIGIVEFIFRNLTAITSSVPIVTSACILQIVHDHLNG
jgi:hypothetical protein